MGIRPETERSFTEAVLKYAHLRGWLVAHFRPAKDRGGMWRTAMAGDPGFPDLVLARDDSYQLRLVVAELKMPGKQPTPAQSAWLANFEAAGVPTYLWTPDDWTDIRRVLDSD